MLAKVVCALWPVMAVGAGGGMPAVDAAPGMVAVQAKAAAPADSGGPMMVDIGLEQRKDGKVERMAAGHVFHTGDVVRLSLRSHYNGFLYVMNQGTSGKFSTVFPSADTGSNNRVKVDGQYLVPAVEDGWFEVDGPPGYDVLYFLLSPAPLAMPSAMSLAAPGPVSSLRPRCNDAIFKARGECMDDAAGPAAVPRGAPLPAPLAPLALGASRDLVFVDEGSGTVGVSGGQASGAGQGQAAGPVLYTFRLAHQDKEAGSTK